MRIIQVTVPNSLFPTAPVISEIRLKCKKLMDTDNINDGRSVMTIPQMDQLKKQNLETFQINTCAEEVFVFI